MTRMKGELAKREKECQEVTEENGQLHKQLKELTLQMTDLKQKREEVKERARSEDGLFPSKSFFRLCALIADFTFNSTVTQTTPSQQRRRKSCTKWSLIWRRRLGSWSG